MRGSDLCEATQKGMALRVEPNQCDSQTCSLPQKAFFTASVLSWDQQNPFLMKEGFGERLRPHIFFSWLNDTFLFQLLVFSAFDHILSLVCPVRTDAEELAEFAHSRWDQLTVL